MPGQRNDVIKILLQCCVKTFYQSQYGVVSTLIRHCNDVITVLFFSMLHHDMVSVSMMIFNITMTLQCCHYNVVSMLHYDMVSKSV